MVSSWFKQAISWSQLLNHIGLASYQLPVVCVFTFELVYSWLHCPLAIGWCKMIICWCRQVIRWFLIGGRPSWTSNKLATSWSYQLKIVQLVFET